MRRIIATLCSVLATGVMMNPIVSFAATANSCGSYTYTSGQYYYNGYAIEEPDAPVFTYNGHTYAFYDLDTIDRKERNEGITDRTKSSYRNVEYFCEVQGGHLAIINTYDENRAIFNQVAGTYDHTVFFGLSDEKREGCFVWSDGTVNTLDLWSVKGGVYQPDNGNGHTAEDYAEFDYDRFNPSGSDNTGLWNDAAFLRNTTVFVCEWEYLLGNAGDNRPALNIPEGYYESQNGEYLSGLEVYGGDVPSYLGFWFDFGNSASYVDFELYLVNGVNHYKAADCRTGDVYDIDIYREGDAIHIYLYNNDGATELQGYSSWDGLDFYYY